jgi:hypothetical protein
MGRTKKATKDGITEDLLRLKVEFDLWRGTRTTGQRIPPQLWSGAVGLVARHGAYRVAKALCLDYAVLKRRAALTGAERPPDQREPSEPKFVEMFVATSTPTPPPSALAAAPARAECVVELVNVRGAKMRVELSASGMAGLAVLYNAFCAAT